jgi:ligand-binding SRPBCC domain-containing protein
MATVDRSVTIAAPAEQVFAYISEPTNLPGVWPSMVEVRDLTPNAGGGTDFAWTYKMAGLKFDGSTTITEFDPPTRLTGASAGGIKSVISWTVTPDGDGCVLAVHAEYTIPGKAFGKLAEPLIVGQNAKEMEVVLANVAAKMGG